MSNCYIKEISVESGEIYSDSNDEDLKIELVIEHDLGKFKKQTFSFLIPNDQLDFFAKNVIDSGRAIIKLKEKNS